MDLGAGIVPLNTGSGWKPSQPGVFRERGGGGEEGGISPSSEETKTWASSSVRPDELGGWLAERSVSVGRLEGRRLASRHVRRRRYMAVCAARDRGARSRVPGSGGESGRGRAAWARSRGVRHAPVAVFSALGCRAPSTRGAISLKEARDGPRQIRDGNDFWCEGHRAFVILPRM